MKIFLRVAAVVMCLCSALRAELPTVEFAGVKYHLASVDISKNGSVTNEYVPQGETIDSWTTLLAVRHWPKAVKIFDAAGPWLTMIHPLLVKNVDPFISNSAKTKDDIVFEAWLAAPDRSYLEINLHRFVIEAGTDGVKAYQFAQKFAMTGKKGDATSFNADTGPFVKNRDTLFLAINKLELPLHRKKE